METINLWNTLAISALTIIGGVWTFFKLFYKYRSKVLFITNCQILHKDVWKAICKHPKVKIKSPGKEDFAFRPLVLLPQSLKRYSDVKNGQKAILENVNSMGESNLKIVAEVFWIPEDLYPYNNIKHPLFSLILRRYFGIERPMYQDEGVEDLEKRNNTEETKEEETESNTDKNADSAKENNIDNGEKRVLNKDNKINESNWMIVRHSDAHLIPLNRADKATNTILWAVSKDYTYRFFNPEDKEYYTYSDENNFIEYCGLSIVLRKRSLAHSEE